MARATTSRGPSSAMRVHVGHESAPAGVAQDRALAAHGLAHKGQRAVAERERRGVELHQLEVGERGAGPGREGRPVGRRPRGVGGARVEPTHAARGERDGARGALAHPPARADRAQPGGAPVADEDLRGPLALGELDARVGAQRGRQGRHDVGPGRVAARVHDAGRRVGALAREAQPAAAAIEDDPSRQELGHLGRPLPADRRRRLGVAQARAGLQRVAQVGRDRVAAVDRRRDAALGPAGAPVAELPLRDDHDRAGLGGSERRQRAGDAAADDDDRLLRMGSGHVDVSLTVTRD